MDCGLESLCSTEPTNQSKSRLHDASGRTQILLFILMNSQLDRCVFVKLAHRESQFAIELQMH